MNKAINPSSDDESASRQEERAETQRAPSTNDSTSIKVWDLPIRVFHWGLVITLCVSAYTGLTGGFMKWISTHLAWCWRWSHSELVGGCWVVTMHALPNLFGPRAVLQSIRSLSMHLAIPLGALSIIALLVSLLVQISTGLFTNDDIFTEGPLAHWVTYEASPAHGNSRDQYLDSWRLITLHLSAISYYELRRETPYPRHGVRSPTRGSRVAGGRRYDGQAVLQPCPLWSNVCGVYWLTTL